MPRNRRPTTPAQPLIELLILPYASAAGRSLLHVLIDELRRGTWSRFQAAVAFAKASGNFPDLVDALRTFAEAGGRVELTFGADIFSGESKGSDLEAVEELVEGLDGLPSAAVHHLYHEKGRTFHPKVYLFSDEDERAALLIVGSSNWSEGGLVTNVEASVVLRLNLSDPVHRKAFDDARKCFADYWEEHNE
jgi:HKD family nuclease